jgi:hypothetical protein
MAKGTEGESQRRETSLKKSKSHIDVEFIATKDFDGPKKDRSCTDVFFLLLILCGWIAMTCEAIPSFAIEASSNLCRCWMGCSWSHS